MTMRSFLLASLLAVTGINALPLTAYATETPYEAPVSGTVVTLPSGAPMTVFPAKDPNGMAVVALPGGGYVYLAVDHEGKDSAPWFNERGITLGVVEYTMPDGNPSLPLTDAWDAVRYFRENKELYHLDPDEIGVMGSSAGGHLAASVSALAPDAECRPDFTILFYPVISLWDSENVHAGSRDALLGKGASEELVRAYSPDLHVDSLTPPAFITFSNDDYLVPSANGLNYYKALNREHKNAVVHIYPTGGHGWGWRQTPYTTLWQDELDNWLMGLSED